MGKLTQVALVFLIGCASRPEMIIVAGSASAEPLEHLAWKFEQEKGVRVKLINGGMGEAISMLRAGQRADVFVATSGDFMKIAIEDSIVKSESVIPICLTCPALIVKSGNPKGITGFDDLASPEVRVTIANPKGVSIGAYGAEILEKNGLAGRANIVRYQPNAAMVINAVSSGLADAGITWAQMAEHHEGVEVVPVSLDLLPRLAVVSVGVVAGSRNPELSLEFLELIRSPEGRAVFGEHGFLLEPPNGYPGEIDGQPIFHEEYWK